MKNYNNPNNKYSYGGLEKKRKRARNLLWLLILLITLSTASAAAIVLGVTNSWFSFTQQTEGDIEFENGIVMKYKDIQVQENGEEKIFYLLKQDGNSSSPLNETNISWGSEFNVISPKVSAAAGSTPFVVRAKLDFSFTKEIDGETETLTLAELKDVLGMETEAETLALIFDDMIEFNTGFLSGNDGWFYYSNKTHWTNVGSSPNLNDMFVFNANAGEVAILKTANNATTSKIKAIPGEGNDMETFYVKSCKILITLDAVEVDASAFNSWLAE
ncbi:MAG: hypothetical protein J5779_01795 [Clostridia bacterium]|nr:hypothetical protein [Clostridia bacterium]